MGFSVARLASCFTFRILYYGINLLGSGCGLVGRLVVSDTRGLWFESSHRQNFVNILLLTVEQTKIETKRSGIAQFKNNLWHPLAHLITVT